MITIQLTEQQKKALAEAVDITVKNTGMSLYTQIVAVLNVLDNPTEVKEDGLSTYALEQGHLPIFNQIFDIALKQVGLVGFAPISDLVRVMQLGVQNAQAQAQAEPQQQPQ